MALKGDRSTTDTEISFFMNQVAERGGAVCMVTAGSGTALDQALATVGYSVSNSGTLQPVGILVNDMVNLDLTRQHINFHRDEVQLGGKVNIIKRGVVTTNMLSGVNGAAVGGLPCYLGNYGLLTQVFSYTGQPRVGTFFSNPDENGFAKVHVNI